MGLVTPAEYVECVEQAYRMHGEGRYHMDPKAHIVLDKYPGEWEAMPSYIEQPEAAACKWVSIREQNRERFDLPTVFSILVYTHPETGFHSRSATVLETDPFITALGGHPPAAGAASGATTVRRYC